MTFTLTVQVPEFAKALLADIRHLEAKLEQLQTKRTMLEKIIQKKKEALAVAILNTQ